MEKIKIDIEQIIAGALLKLDRVSNIDKIILVEHFLTRYPDCEVQQNDLEQLKKYIDVSEKNISLQKDLDSSINNILEEIAGTYVGKYFQSFDFEEFLLRKIDYFSQLEEFNYSEYLDEIKPYLATLRKLVLECCLVAAYEGEFIYDEQIKFKLSKSGKIKLFKADNAEALNKFTEMLRSLRYDITLIDDFLFTQDLDMPVWAVLDLPDFHEFCKKYDRNMLDKNVSSIKFTRLDGEKEALLTEEEKTMLEDMFSISDNTCIHICHPNHIFKGSNLLTADVKEIVNVDWNAIDVEKMFRKNEYKTFESNSGEILKHLYKCLAVQIASEIKHGNEELAAGYLAVIEEHTFDFEDNYIVRGIIKADSKGYSLAFNPEYKKGISQRVGCTDENINIKYLNRFYDPKFSAYDFMVLFSIVYSTENGNCFNRDSLISFINYCKKNSKFTKLLEEINLRSNGLTYFSEDFDEAISKLKIGRVLYTISPEKDATIYIFKDIPDFNIINPRLKYLEEMVYFIGEYKAYEIKEKNKVFVIEKSEQ